LNRPSPAICELFCFSILPSWHALKGAGRQQRPRLANRGYIF
jgi:hypothetical protein